MSLYFIIFGELIGRRIGAYRILDVLGTGGMSVVYRAQQDQPRRVVALKILRRSLPSPSLLRRFRYESQILGRLHHAGIAQIYEAGMHGGERRHQQRAGAPQEAFDVRARQKSAEAHDPRCRRAYRTRTWPSIAREAGSSPKRHDLPAIAAIHP